MECFCVELFSCLDQQLIIYSTFLSLFLFINGSSMEKKCDKPVRFCDLMDLSFYVIGSSVLSIQQLQYLCNLQLTFYLTCFSQFLFSFLLHVAASLFDPLPSSSNGLFSRGNLKNACLLAEPNPWLQLGQGQPLAMIQCSANELSANK